MEQNNVVFVEKPATPEAQVAGLLIYEGFGLADWAGIGIERETAYFDGVERIGVLYHDPEIKPRKYLFGLITIKPRRVFLGVVFVNDSESWTFEVNGRKYNDFATQLAEKLALTFDVKIAIRIVSEQSKEERFFHETYLGM